ncbi:MAG: glycosyltransferase [Slackia sp.]|nr:glycosyltransferase [Slackia sp.]
MNTNPVRVLHVIGAMNRAGAESMIMNLYRACDTRRVQFDFLVNETGDYDGEIIERGGRIYRIPRFTLANYASYRKACAEFFAEHDEFAIVHGHIGLPAAIYLRIARENGMVAIAHSHAQNYPLSPQELAFRIASRPVRHNADYFMACSMQAGIDRFGTNIAHDESRFHVLNNGIDLASYRFDENTRHSVRKELGIDAETPVFGHVGRFDPVKNHRFLLEVFACILNDMPNARLVLAGRPDEDGSVRAYSHELGIEDRIMFLGVRSDVARILSAFDVFVFTSFKEGLGMAVVEAQATGLPCVVSTGVPEIARVSDLVSFLDLDAGAQAWADEALRCYRNRNTHRASAIDDVRRAGFDINESAAWLQDFYLEHACRQ